MNCRKHRARAPWIHAFVVPRHSSPSTILGHCSIGRAVWGIVPPAPFPRILNCPSHYSCCPANRRASSWVSTRCRSNGGAKTSAQRTTTENVLFRPGHSGATGQSEHQRHDDSNFPIFHPGLLSSKDAGIQQLSRESAPGGSRFALMVPFFGFRFPWDRISFIVRTKLSHNSCHT